MIKKIVIFIIIAYFLTLIQASFLPHFGFRGIIPNLVLILVFFVNLFEGSDKKSGLVFALAAGFFLDIFSGNFIGFYAAISLAIAIFLKYFLRNYIKLPVWI
jgi:rod shape-determining protein MreD